MAKSKPSNDRHKEIFDSIVKQIEKWPQLMYHEHNQIRYNNLKRFKQSHKHKTRIIKDDRNE